MRKLNQKKFEEFCLEVLTLFKRPQSLYYVSLGLTFSINTNPEKKLILYRLYAKESPINNITLILVYNKCLRLQVKNSKIYDALSQPSLYDNYFGDDPIFQALLRKYFR